MTDVERICVDLMKFDDERRIKLVTVGTREDLAKYGIELREGLLLHLYTDYEDLTDRRDDLIVDGLAHLDEDTGTWVAIIDWDKIQHESGAAGA
jgi:hypothetical protein